MWKHKQKPGTVSALKSASINGGDYMKNILRFLLPALALIFTVVEKAPSKNQTTLYNFRGQKDGNGPGAKLVADASGNLYGTTLFGGGGCSGKGCGAIFELSPSGTGYTEKIIYGFKGTPDAESPTSILIDASGNLYGTSFSGGSNGDGTVWELSPTGSSWTETILHNFNGTDGGFAASLITDGTNFYGVAEEGGAAANGAVFELSPSSGGWTESVLYSFTGGKDGAQPDALTIDAAGNLYGATFSEGDPTCTGLSGTGCGTIFSLQPSAGTWILHLLFTFHGTHGPNGAQPFAGVVLDAAGNLYGGTRGGGISQNGVVFKLTPTAVGEWKETVLHRFTGGTDSSTPAGGLMFDAAGNLYGASDGSIANSPSNIFRLSPAASGGWIYAIVSAFPTFSDCGGPSYIDAAGNLYGVTELGSGGQGSIYELTP
jgi:uncharacterized repeat protein (TIGR03803 family)